MEEKVIIDKSKLTAIGDAIRSKTGSSATFTVDEMVETISTLGSGGATIKTSGIWVNTPVPNEDGTYVENIYFNTSLSVEEVVEIVANSNIPSLDEGYGIVVDSNVEKLYLAMVCIDGMVAIVDFLTETYYFHNIVEAEAEFGFLGWNPNSNGVISVNANIVNDGSVGAQNDLISGLIGINPIFELQEGAPIELNGEYKETTIKITEKGTIDVKELIANKQIPLKIVGDFIDLRTCLTMDDFLDELNDEEITYIRQGACAGIYTLANVNLPNVEVVAECAFYHCGCLANVNLPNATNIYHHAFEGCSALKEIDISNATRIGRNAFSNCYYLTTVNCPNVEPEKLEDWAFSHCSELKNLYFPKVTHIKEGTFYYCESLTSITEENFPSVVFVGKEAFYNCASLTEFDLPNVGAVRENALAYTGIKVLRLPSVKIGFDLSIKNMPYLEALYLPNLQSFPFDTTFFSNCDNLTDIYLGYDSLVSSNEYFKLSLGNASNKPRIHVKSAQLNKYKNNTIWSEYFEKGLIIGDYEEVVGNE